MHPRIEDLVNEIDHIYYVLWTSFCNYRRGQSLTSLINWKRTNYVRFFCVCQVRMKQKLIKRSAARYFPCILNGTEFMNTITIFIDVDELRSCTVVPYRSCQMRQWLFELLDTYFFKSSVFHLYHQLDSHAPWFGRIWRKITSRRPRQVTQFWTKMRGRNSYYTDFLFLIRYIFIATPNIHTCWFSRLPRIPSSFRSRVDANWTIDSSKIDEFFNVFTHFVVWIPREWRPVVHALLMSHLAWISPVVDICLSYLHILPTHFR